jgi:hypothetical protein
LKQQQKKQELKTRKHFAGARVRNASCSRIVFSPLCSLPPILRLSVLSYMYFIAALLAAHAHILHNTTRHNTGMFDRMNMSDEE